VTHPQQPQQPPAWGAPPPQPPKKAPVGKIIGLGCGGLIVLFVLLAIAGALISDKSDPKPTPPATPPVSSAAGAPSPAAPAPAQPSAPAPAAGDAAAGDVQLSDCSVDSVLKWPSVKVTITNKSSKSSNYLIQVEFLDSAGVRISEGVAAANSVAAGQTAVQKAQGTSETSGKVTCKVLKVTRYAAG
jgi:hypothetical protein